MPFVDAISLQTEQRSSQHNDAAATAITADQRSCWGEPEPERMFNHWNHAFLFGEQSVIQNANIRRILVQPGGSEYWSKATASGSIFTPAFIEYIDALTVKTDGHR